MERLIAEVQNIQSYNSVIKERSAINFVHDIVDFEVIRDSEALTLGSHFI